MVSVNAVRYLGYFGAAVNWLIPIAGIVNFPTRKPSDIDPVLTSLLASYSAIFLRWSIAISPANYPLCFCHLTNTTVQAATLCRYAYGRMNAKTIQRE
ncbi:Mitochondrial pyruvate carrier [Trypanosoma melophagium]|uniref:Mitochondrial pyruvate carrier n=1 Tax=Trypanosoma melophagium TaxID=715481 RepID=UPI00351A8F72|nr:Mitochondrial pyruvate carrier [Trypanosoma melophagium]